MMGTTYREEWNELQSLLNEVCVSTEEDEIVWGLSSSKAFTTSPLYKFLTSGGISCRMAKKIWKWKVP
jgi:hypothetical protein